MNPFSLEGKTVLVTGASSGIGRQCAIACSHAGAKVVLMARSEERLKQTIGSMLRPNEHVAQAVDLTDFEAVDEAMSKLNEQVGRLDGVVNCAGVSSTLPYKLCIPQKAEEIFRTNVVSAYNLTREAVKMGRFSKNGGSVIFIASIMAQCGENGKSLYSMTKGALVSGARSLALELAPKKIRVNCISPGAILTPINQNLPHMADPERRKVLEDLHPLGLGQTEDVANACVYLLSDASRWVTGTNIVVDGGYSSR